MTIDSRTLIIKTDNENDLLEIIDYINQKNKSRLKIINLIVRNVMVDRIFVDSNV